MAESIKNDTRYFVLATKYEDIKSIRIKVNADEEATERITKNKLKVKIPIHSLIPYCTSIKIETPTDIKVAIVSPIKEIIIASIRMSGVILSRKEKAAPVIMRVKIPLKSEFCKVILANSITLTPGTITADFEDDVFVIHCINESFAEGIEECSFVKILERVEK